MSSPPAQARLDELSDRFGIVSDYHDIFGQRHVTSADTKRAILGAMGVKVETEEDVARELAESQDAVWRTPCDPVLVCRMEEERAKTWSFRMPAKADEDQALRIEWTIQDENGGCRVTEEAGLNLIPVETHVINNERYVRFELPLPTGLEIGYYDLTATGSAPSRCVEGRLRLILTPTQCYMPPRLDEGVRTWGLSLQLYSLRSSTNWGVGDFGDLADCVEWAATDLGAGMIGINPLHALKNSRPFHISPYSPDSRLWLNMLYLAIERIPEWSECPEAQQLLEDEPFRSRLEVLREQETVNYEQVCAVKRKVLKTLFGTFQERHCGVQGDTLEPRTSRGRAFEHYVRQQGDLLETFAVFQALSETLSQEGTGHRVWQEWPEQYRDARSPAVGAYRTAHRPLIRFHQYVQWVASEQLQAVSRRAEELEMPLGLYHDLALGSDRTGSDAWMFQDVLALSAECGAPPDDFALEGQNWGLPPVIPHRLRHDGYRMFIHLLRNNLTNGGALRIDHVLALFRLFWVPRGMPASAGAYVRYPWEDLLGILALESVRHRTVIVGEDLGTVPDFVREKLAAYRVLSYRVFYFERQQDGEWKTVREYPQDALAVVSTHDLPTLAGYWATEDIELRQKLGLYAEEGAYRAALDERRRDKARILQALLTEGVLAGDSKTWSDSFDWSLELAEAVHAYVARTPSRLLLVSLEDMLGERAQVNLPGTVDAYPNWSLKIPLALDALRVDPRPQRLAAVLRNIRPQQGSSPS